MTYINDPSPFPDVAPFPATPAPATASLGHNRAPIEEQIVIDFEEAIAESGLKKRVADLVAGAGRVGAVDSDDKAGKVADLIKMVRVAKDALEAEREKLNRPILTAQRNLKGRSDGYAAQMVDAMAPVHSALDTYAREQRRIADEARRAAEQRARDAAEAERARLAAMEPDTPEHEKEAIVQRVEAAFVQAVAPAEAPKIRGDYGSTIGTKTTWLHEIESVRQLPDSILKHEKVLESLNKVVGALVRGGSRSIKGVRIWSEQNTVVR